MNVGGALTPLTPFREGILAKLPWFQFQATSWLSDPQVRLMSSQQRGWYIDMLCWCWQENGMHANALRTLCVSSDIDDCSDFGDLKNAFDDVLSHFTFQLDDGKISHPKLEELRSEISQRSEKATYSANMRWHGKRKAKAMRTHCDSNARASKSISISNSSSEDLKKEKDGEILKPEFDDQWLLFRKIYESTGKPLIEKDFTKAHYMWRLLDFGQRTEAIANLSARKTHHDPQFIPSPERYLYDGEYSRGVVPRPANGTGRGKKDIVEEMLEEERAKRA